MSSDYFRKPQDATGQRLKLLPRLLSGVFLHSIHQVVVKRDEVADERSGAQAQTVSLRQQNLKVSVQIQILLSVISRQLQLSWHTHKSNKDICVHDMTLQ